MSTSESKAGRQAQGVGVLGTDGGSRSPLPNGDPPSPLIDPVHPSERDPTFVPSAHKKSPSANAVENKALADSNTEILENSASGENADEQSGKRIERRGQRVWLEGVTSYMFSSVPDASTAVRLAREAAQRERDAELPGQCPSCEDWKRQYMSLREGVKNWERLYADKQRQLDDLLQRTNIDQAHAKEAYEHAKQLFWQASKRADEFQAELESWKQSYFKASERAASLQAEIDGHTQTWDASSRGAEGPTSSPEAVGSGRDSEKLQDDTVGASAERSGTLHCARCASEIYWQGDRWFHVHDAMARWCGDPLPGSAENEAASRQFEIQRAVNQALVDEEKARNTDEFTELDEMHAQHLRSGETVDAGDTRSSAIGAELEGTRSIAGSNPASATRFPRSAGPATEKLERDVADVTEGRKGIVVRKDEPELTVAEAAERLMDAATVMMESLPIHSESSAALTRKVALDVGIQVMKLTLEREGS